MKKALYFFLIAGFFFSLHAYEKKSLVERFTNASCGPCATINNAWYNTTLSNLVNTQTVSHIIYNGWWPGSGDPMYLLNQSDNTTRINYYGVNSVPWIDVNGALVSTGSSAQLLSAVNTGNGEYSPFMIVIAKEEFSQTMMRFNVKVFRDPNDNTTFGNIKFRLALTEKTVVFSSPPGSNGESRFPSVCRKMLPDANGTTLTIPAPGEFTEFTLDYVPTSQFISSVILDSIKVVAFIQDDNNKYIYQSFVAEDYNSTILGKSSDVMTANNLVSNFTTQILNSGLLDDSYQIQISLNAPEGWTGEYTTVNGTFPFETTDVINVTAGNTENISLSVNPNGINGFGETTVNFISQNDPEIISTTVLRNITNTGVDLLVVDASNQGYGDYIYNSLDEIYSGTYGIITKDAITNSENGLSGFSIVAWSAGMVTPVFSTDEVTMLQDFLDQNGQLFINGQNIGADIFETTGQSQHAQSFYNEYLHANYVQNVGTGFLLQGYTGDPISDGLLFVLGDVYVKSPDQISAFNADATPIFKFGSGPNNGALRASTEDYRVVYLGFGVEQISDQAIRDTLISRAVRWLEDGIVTDVENYTPAPTVYSLEQNYPNPFNPATVIKYQVPTAGKVMLKIYDLLGKEITTLVNENQNAGFYSIPFDASNLSSGIYFYTLTSGEFTSTKKMTLVK